MKKILMALSTLALLAGCNGNSGEKGPALARIDGKTYTEGDLDLRLHTLGDDRREAVMRDPEERRKEYNRILRAHLFALAADHAGLTRNDSLRHRLALIDQRVTTQYYFENFINANGGHTRQEIEEYYRANPSKFAGDSGKAMSFEKAFPQAVDSLLVSKANLDSVYQAGRKLYSERAYCEVSLIQTAKRKDAETALKALQGGMKFGDAAAKFSLHGSKTNQGKIGHVIKGESNFDIGYAAPADSLFFNPQTRLKPGQISGPVPKDSGFIVVRVDSCKEENLPSLNQIRSRVVTDYLRDLRTSLQQNAIARLKEKYQVRLITPYKSPTETDIKDYYEKNKDGYESPETFELYHIEIAKKEKILTRFKALKDLEGFKALAKQVSENTWTKEQGGYMGIVKRDYCLPYGIGMLPELFPALDSLKEGKVPSPLQSTDTQKWQFFWLAKKMPRQLKPLERVHSLVQADLAANHITQIKPEDSLAAIGNTQALRESDVKFLKAEIPDQMQERYTRENLVDYLLTWKLASDEAEALGLTKEKRLMALRLENQENFWVRVYEDSVLNRTYEEDTALLASTFKEKGKTLTRDSADTDWHKHVRDIAALLTLSPKDFDVEYHVNPEKYKRDTVLMPFSDAQYDIFQNLKSLGTQRAEKKLLKKLQERFNVRVLDPSLEEPTYEPALDFYKKAQSLHYDRKLDQALELYEQLREKFPDQADLQDSIAFGVAQIYVEQERYQQAMAEYRRVSYLYPKSSNDYKAMFMVGFIYSEHLKNDSAAVRAFVSMLSKYPKTDLSDDADWMIRNIRSGGKLMPVLEGDSGWVAPDSGKTRKATTPPAEGQKK